MPRRQRIHRLQLLQLNSNILFQRRETIPSLCVICSCIIPAKELKWIQLETIVQRLVKSNELIFLVEDDKAIAKNLILLLRPEGFTVIQTPTRKEAAAILAGNKFYLALSDISLPDGNGFTICTEIKQTQEMPMIFLTASGDEVSVVTGLNMGEDYVIKPFRPRELVARIKCEKAGVHVLFFKFMGFLLIQRAVWSKKTAKRFFSPHWNTVCCWYLLTIPRASSRGTGSWTNCARRQASWYLFLPILLQILRSKDLTFQSKHPSQSVAEMKTVIQDEGTTSAYILLNTSEILEESRNYIFIANVFNMISTNVNLCRRELAMLRLAGISDRNFNKMMRFESVSYDFCHNAVCYAQDKKGEYH